MADTCKMIGGIGLEVGIPFHFFRENHLAVDEGGAFAIGTPEVEPNAAAAEITAKR